MQGHLRRHECSGRKVRSDHWRAWTSSCRHSCRSINIVSSRDDGVQVHEHSSGAVERESQTVVACTRGRAERVGDLGLPRRRLRHRPANQQRTPNWDLLEEMRGGEAQRRAASQPGVGTLFRNCGSCVVEVKRRQLGCVIRAIANVAELCKSSQSVNIGVNLRRGEMRLSTVGRSSHVYAAAQAVGIDIETEVAFSLRNADVIKVVVKPQGFKWDNRDFLVVSEHHIKRIVRAKKGCEKEIERLISKTMHDQEGTTPTESKPAAKVSFAMPDQEPAYKTPRKRQATMARPARSIARNPSYSALKRAIEAEAAKRGADVRAGDVATMMAYENSVGEAVYPSFDDVTGAGYYQTMEPTYISRPTVPLSEPFYELAN